MRRRFAAAIAMGVLAAAVLGTHAASAAPTQVAYTNDFEHGVGNEWSASTISATPSGRKFLGQFTNSTAQLTLAGLARHTQATVEFDLYVIRTWDGNGPVNGPDVFDLTVAPDPPLVHTTFANFTTLTQSYPDAHPGGSHPGLTGATEKNTLGYIVDSVYHLSKTITHSTPAMAVQFTGSGLQNVSDEGWGVDNVRVLIDGDAPTVVPAQSQNQTVPAQSSPSIPGQHQQTPPVGSPGNCELDPCKRPTPVPGGSIPAQQITTPAVPSQSIDTPTLTVPETCTAVICIDKITIPSKHIATTPPVPAQTVTTPSQVLPGNEIPSICSKAPSACDGNGGTLVPAQNVDTPGVQPMPLTPQISVTITTTQIVLSANPNFDQQSTIQPQSVTVTVPEVGPVTIRICPQSCAVPASPAVHISFTLTISINTGSETRIVSVPVNQ